MSTNAKIEPVNIKYVEDREDYGIEYDWNLIFKNYHKLKTPDTYYDPTTLPVTSAKYFDLISERASGKTTNVILLGMVMNLMYGTVIQYIRQSEDMIKPSVAGEIFNVILSYENGRYIKDMTGYKYNSIYTHWKKSYFCHIDDEGKMDLVAEKPFLQFLSIDNNFDYKSTYNAPKGDLILFDEFISPYYRLNEFVDFLDLVCTIVRKRVYPIVIMLGNAIDYNNEYFKEQEISKEIKKLKVGQHALIETEKGTKVYVEIIGVKQTEIKTKINRLFFGFNNPRLASITGGEQAWAFRPVPHITIGENDKILERRIKLDCDDVYLTLEIVKTEDRGLIVNVHECSSLYKDSIILTLKDITSKNQLFGLGHGKFFKMLWTLYEHNKWYYQNNEVGSMVTAYIKKFKQMKSEMLTKR